MNTDWTLGRPPYFIVDANDIAALDEMAQEAAYRALLPLQDAAVQRFVDIDGSNAFDRQRVLVGPKGSGKTLWLEARSFFARRRHDANRIRFPKTRLYERISGRRALADAISRRPNLWRSIDMWRDAWTLALELVAFDIAGLRAHLTPQERDLLTKWIPITHSTEFDQGDQVSVSEYLQVVVTLFNEKTWREKVSTLQSGILERRLRMFTPPLEFYLDAPDEAVSSTIESDFDSVACRLELQAGLLFAIREVENIKQNLSVFATMRAEVYGSSRKIELFQQVQDRCLPLVYDADRLEKIFAKNCEAANNARGVKNTSDPLTAFFGLQVVTQGCTLSDTGKPLSEPVISHVLRHTYYRPRDLMVMGQAILLKIDEKSVLNDLQLRDIINEVAHNLQDNLRTQLEPDLLQIFENACRAIPANVIHVSTISSIRKKYSELHNSSTCPLTYLYGAGLLGIENKTAKVQEFLIRRHEYNPSELQLPASDWYFIHPTLNKTLLQIHGNSFKKSTNTVCGHGASTDQLAVLRFVQHRKRLSIEYLGQEIYVDCHTKPAAALAIFAYAAKQNQTSRPTLETLRAAQRSLIDSGLDIVRLVEIEGQELYLDGLRDQIKQVNRLLRAHNFDGIAIQARKNGFLFNICLPQAVALPILMLNE